MEKRKSKLELSKKSRIIIIGSLLFLVGVFLYVGERYYDYYLEAQDDKLVEEFINKVPEEVVVNVDEVEDEEETTQVNYEYIGALEIPVIDFRRGFVAMDDPNNTVDKNIEVIEQSDMPNVQNGNLIIAAHSGTGRRAYFKNLNKVVIGAEVYVYYDNIKYTYQVIDIYEVEKTGEVMIERNREAKTLTLITCKPNSDTKQIVVICELVEEVPY